MRLALLVSAHAVAAMASAQSCPRPVPPFGGFLPVYEAVVPVTYSDGYQTFGTLLRPDAPSPCGWPLVVFVHPLGQARGYDFQLQLSLAAQGYAVWSYDVRAQGDALLANVGHANAGSTVWGPVEVLDLAEQITFVGGNAAWAGVVDATRVAVVGSSQGGAHAWSAAALSGRPVQVPGRPPLTFPSIACVLASDLVADASDDWVRDGVMFSSIYVNILAGAYAYTGVPFDAGFVQTGRTAFLAQDAPSLAAVFAAEGRLTRTHVATSTVPILYSHAYHDFVADPLQGLLALSTTAGPRRALIGTVGPHDTPANVTERAFRDSVLLRWLHRFLWGMPNEVEFERPYILSELPLDPAQRDDPASEWSRAHVANPLQTGATTRWFLHDDLALSNVPPLAPQLGTAVTQVLDPLATDFTPIGYLDLPAVRDLTNVLQACPLDEVIYSATVASEAELSRCAAVHLRVVPDRPEWMLAVLLTVQPPGGAPEVLLASRAVASRTSVAGIAEDRDFLLPPSALRIPADSTVRLRLRNLWLYEYPMTRALAVAPLFHDFNVAIVHGQTDGSWIDLPLEPVRPKIVSATTWLDLGTMAPVNLQLRGGAARPQLPYFLAVGLSGQLPSTPHLNDIVPIELDWLVGASVATNEPPFFAGFVGVTDAAGNVGAQMDFSLLAPLPEILSGMQLTVIGFILDGEGALTGASSNACDILLR